MPTTPPVTKLSALRTVARQLKKDAKKADLNGNARLSATEIRKYGASKNDGFATGKALLTLQRWALRDAERAVTASVESVQGKADEAIFAIKSKDANGNGKIDAGKEFNAAKRLKTFQAFSDLLDGGTLTGLSTAELTKALKGLSKDADYMSESDYWPLYLTSPMTKPMTAQNIFKALQPKLDKAFYGDRTPAEMASFVMNGGTKANTDKFIKRLVTVDNDPSVDEAYRVSARAFGKIIDTMKANLSDLTVISYGPGDASGTLTDSQGLYVDVVAGKNKDGQLVAMALGRVWT